MKLITKILVVVAIVLAGIGAIGFAYSYTSQSDNTGNSSYIEYVVIYQGNYSFGSGSITYNTVTTLDSNEDPVTTFFLGGVTEDLEIGDNDYKGFKVGNSDTLWD